MSDSLVHNIFDDHGLIDFSSFPNVNEPLDGVYVSSDQQSVYSWFEENDLLPESRSAIVLEEENGGESWAFKNPVVLDHVVLGLKRDYSSFSEESSSPISVEDDIGGTAYLKPTKRAEYIVPPCTTDEESASDKDESVVQPLKRCKISYAAAIETQRKLRTDALFPTPCLSELAIPGERKLRSDVAPRAVKFETTTLPRYKNHRPIRIGLLNGIRHVHAVDLASVVVRVSNVARLFRKFVEGIEVTLASVNKPNQPRGQVSCVLTYAGICRFIELPCVRGYPEYIAWVKETILPILL